MKSVVPGSPECETFMRARLLTCALLLTIAACVAVPFAVSADRETEQRDADARQKLFIRRALAEDERLAPYTAELWVEVRGTTAVLSGKMPSAALKQRALYVAGQVKGIGAVRGEELLVAAPDGVPDVPSPFVEGAPPRGALPGNRATLEPRKADVPDAGRSPPPVTLLAPIHVGAPAPAESPGALVTFLPPQPIPEPADLSSSVEALRRKEERFRRLKVDLRGKTVYVSGTVSRWADATDLVNAVRRLPGVAAVIADNIQVDRSGAH